MGAVYIDDGYRQAMGGEVGWLAGCGGLGKKHVREHAPNTVLSLSLPHFIFQSQKFRVYCALGLQWDTYLFTGLAN